MSVHWQHRRQFCDAAYSCHGRQLLVLWWQRHLRLLPCWALLLSWCHCQVHATAQLPCRRGALLRAGLRRPLRGRLLRQLPLEQRRLLLLLQLLRRCRRRLQHGGQEVV